MSDVMRFDTPEERREYWKRVRIAQGWHAGNNGSGKRNWFACRETESGLEWHLNKNGDVIRYGSHEAATKIADKLNAQAA